MNKINTQIYYGKHYIDSKDIKAVTKVLKSGLLTQGKEVNKFEKKIKNYFGSKYVIALSNGTSALNLVSKALDWKKNDIIFCSPITFAASSNCILQQKAKVSFVDINKDNFNIDTNLIIKKLSNEKIRKNAKAIIATDFAGNPCEWEKLKMISKKYKLVLINDNCHALGSKYKNDKKYINKYADIGIHSYHAVKNLTTGEGGSILTNNKKFYDKAKLLVTHGIKKNINNNKPWEYDMLDLGYNYRLTDIQASLGISQIKKLDKFVKFRQKVAKIYDKSFFEEKIFAKQLITKNNKSAYHLYPLLIDFKKLKKTKIGLFRFLKKHNINLQVHYKPIYKFKYYSQIKYLKKLTCKNAENFYKKEVSLPIYFNLKIREQMKVIKYIKKYLFSN